MSAWPEAVWIVKRMNQITHIDEKIAAAEREIAPLWEKLEELESKLEDIDTAKEAISDMESLQAQVDELNVLSQQLQNPEILETTLDFINNVNKELVVIATNTGTSNQPNPRDIGTNVVQHSIFLIVDESAG